MLATSLLVGAVGCTSLPEDPEERRERLEANDPLEPLNRQIFAVNQALDVVLLRPVAVVYRDVVPEGGKRVVNNFVSNLRLPFTVINDVLQGQWDRAGSGTVRFVLNSTFGIGGLFDMATPRGYPHHDEDFGQTLATWGVGDGPYLVLPLVGPSNFRDTVGLGVQYFGDPVSVAVRATDYEDWLWARTGLEVVNTRYQFLGPLDDLEKNSLDFYASMRSLYRQRRTDAIANGRGAMDQRMGGSDLSQGMRSQSQGLDSLRDLMREAVGAGPMQPAAR